MAITTRTRWPAGSPEAIRIVRLAIEQERRIRAIAARVATIERVRQREHR